MTTKKFKKFKPKYSGPNLDLQCVKKLDNATFSVNYAKLYFDAKQMLL